MTPVTVYRIDYVKKTKVKVGTIFERRRKDRGDNLRGLLFLAKRSFASSPQEAFLTALDLEEAKTAQRTGGQRLPSLFTP